jgi:hypothetical protein
MSLRTSIVGSSAALLLTGGLLTSVPSPAAAHDHWKPWGYIKAPDQKLRAGCHRYVYRYKVDPPTNDWAAEMFLVNPRGVGIASYAVSNNSDPAKDRLRWSTPLCRASLRPGRYKVKMKVTWNPDPGDPTPDNVEGWVHPSRFRLYR